MVFLHPIFSFLRNRNHINPAMHAGLRDGERGADMEILQIIYNRPELISCQMRIVRTVLKHPQGNINGIVGIISVKRFSIYSLIGNPFGRFCRLWVPYMREFYGLSTVSYFCLKTQILSRNILVKYREIDLVDSTT